MRKIQLGDFVRYEGDYTTLDPLRRNEAIAQIISSDENGDEWRVLIEVPEGRISCHIQYTRPIHTEAVHLRRLGFKEVSFDQRKYFERDGVILSGAGGSVHSNGRISYFVTGYALGNLTNLRNAEMQNYINGEGFDPVAFSKVYPNMNNINAVFDVLEEKGIEINKREVLRLPY